MKKHLYRMDTRGQGALEFTVLIAAAILVAVIALNSTTQIGSNLADNTQSNYEQAQEQTNVQTYQQGGPNQPGTETPGAGETPGGNPGGGSPGSGTGSGGTPGGQSGTGTPTDPGSDPENYLPPTAFAPSRLAASNDFFRVFVSSQGYHGNLEGLAGADAKCLSLATQAGLDGNWMAYLGIEGVSPQSRLFPSTKPYYRLDGNRVANDWNDLLDYPLIEPINLDENGGLVPASTVWTGSAAWVQTYVGITSDTCDRWTINTGYFKRGYGGNTQDWELNPLGQQEPGRWEGFTASQCALFNRLYCFEQPFLNQNTDQNDSNNYWQVTPMSGFVPMTVSAVGHCSSTPCTISWDDDNQTSAVSGDFNQSHTYTLAKQYTLSMTTSSGTSVLPFINITAADANAQLQCTSTIASSTTIAAGDDVNITVHVIPDQRNRYASVSSVAGTLCSGSILSSGFFCMGVTGGYSDCTYTCRDFNLSTTISPQVSQLVNGETIFAVCPSVSITVQ